MYSNQLTIVIVENILEDKEPEFFTNTEILEEQVKTEKGYYQCVYVIIWFNNDFGVESKDEKADMEDDTDEEEMEDAKLDDERKIYWRMGF